MQRWPTINSRLSGRVRLDDRAVVMMSSNDYLGLASDQRVLAGARRALDQYGAGTGMNPALAVTGVHRELMEELADFLGTESALLFNSCTAANCAVIQTLADDPSTCVLSDELNHASIIDGCRLARGRTLVYAHGEMDALDMLLAGLDPMAGKVIVTDGVFSMEGNVAALEQIQVRTHRSNATLVVDESHAIGVIGETGRGSSELRGLTEPPIQTGTFAKALGAGIGGYLAAPREVIEGAQRG